MGHGGPWKNTFVKAGHASDPCLIGFYDKKMLSITHDAQDAVNFRIEVDPTGHGPWLIYKEVRVSSSETFEYTFPGSFQPRWIRFVTGTDCKATTWLEHS